MNITDSTWDIGPSGGETPAAWFARVRNGSAAAIDFAVDAICTEPTSVTRAADLDQNRRAKGSAQVASRKAAVRARRAANK